MITKCYGERRGVVYMNNGLKVYYLPLFAMMDVVAFPTFYGLFSVVRDILIREEIDIVHGHQATSTLMHEVVLMARTMGYSTVYTDHSLFGFKELSSIHLNKLMKFTLSDVQHAIAVSHTCRENLVLRASMDANCISVIPNAVDASKFMPYKGMSNKDMPNKDMSEKCMPDKDLSEKCMPNGNGVQHPNKVVIVIISRLVYRKGIDLVVKTIPMVAKKFEFVDFIIGGDGPKRLLLEEMREMHRLHDRVEILGSVPHDQVAGLLNRGDIFLNSSLTESFCIAILEAVSCGLFVVSTKVGGIPEVLPKDMIEYAVDTTPIALANAIELAIPKMKHVKPMVFHERVRKMYNWHDVAKRTAVVYEQIGESKQYDLYERFCRYYGIGPIAGGLACIVVAMMHLYWRFLEWLVPRHSIEIAYHVKNNDIMKARNKHSEY